MTSPILTWEQAKWPLEAGDEITAAHFEDLRRRYYLALFTFAGADDSQPDYETDGTAAPWSCISDSFPTSESGGDTFAEVGEWTITWGGELWVNKAALTKSQSASTTYRPPDDVHPSANTWVLENSYWTLAADENKYHHFDKNSPRYYGHYDQKTSGGVPYSKSRTLVEAWRMLPRQMDPAEIERPVLFSSTNKPGWQYDKGCQRLAAEVFTQTAKLGAVRGTLSITLGYWNDIRNAEFVSGTGYVLFEIAPFFSIPFARIQGPLYGDQYIREGGFPGQVTGGPLVPAYTYENSGLYQQYYFDEKICDAYQNMIERIASSRYWHNAANSEYATNWEGYTGLSWEAGKYGTHANGDIGDYWCTPYPRLNDSLWGCNESAFEAILSLLGDEYFDWYYDQTYIHFPQKFQQLRYRVYQSSGLTQADLQYPLPVGTWRRTLKYSMGRVRDTITLPNGNTVPAMRASEKGTPTGQNWGSSIWSNAAYPGIFVSSYPALDDFIEWTLTISTFGGDRSWMIFSGDQTAKLKPGWLVFVTNADSIHESVRVISAVYDSGSNQTTVHVDAVIGSYAGTMYLKGDSRISENHDPSQYDYENDLPEYEIKGTFLNALREVMKKLFLANSENLNITVKRLAYYTGNYGYMTPAYYQGSGSILSQSAAVKAAKDEFWSEFAANNLGDPDTGYDWYTGSGTILVCAETEVSNNQLSDEAYTPGYWPDVEPRGGHNTGGYQAVNPSDSNLWGPYQKPSPFCFSAGCFVRMAAFKLERTGGRVGTGLGRRFGLCIRGTCDGGYRRDRYTAYTTPYPSPARLHKTEGVSVDAGQISFSCSPGEEVATPDDEDSTFCGDPPYYSWRSTRYDTPSKSFQAYMAVTPSNAWHITYFGDFPNPPAIGGSSWLKSDGHCPTAGYNADRKTFASAHKGVGFTLRSDAIMELDLEAAPSSVWERDLTNHIDRVNPPTDDRKPPRPNPPVWYSGPRAYFVYVPYSEGPPEVTEKFEIWVTMTAGVSEDMEGSDPVNYRGVGYDDAPDTEWGTSRTVTVKLGELSMTEAIFRDEYEITNDITRVNANWDDEIKIPLDNSAEEIEAGDLVFLDVGRYRGVYEVLAAETAYITVDISEYGYIAFEDVSPEAGEKLYHCVPYDEGDWDADEYAGYRYSLQSKDSATVENAGKLSEAETIAAPEEWPLDIYREEVLGESV